MARIMETNYFGMFVEVGEYACQTAKMLKQVLWDFSPDSLPEKMAALHVIENAADEKKHILLEKLAKEFIAPIEREDILAITSQLDDVVDGIEDILIKIYMFQIKQILPEAQEFVDIILHCCDCLKTILMEFRNFKKSNTIHANIIDLNRLEELGDTLYIKAVRKLYENNGGNMLEIIAWTEVFGQMERCCDACEHTANMVEEVIMKNT